MPAQLPGERSEGDLSGKRILARNAHVAVRNHLFVTWPNICLATLPPLRPIERVEDGVEQEDADCGHAAPANVQAWFG